MNDRTPQEQELWDALVNTIGTAMEPKTEYACEQVRLAADRLLSKSRECYDQMLVDAAGGSTLTLLKKLTQERDQATHDAKAMAEKDKFACESILKLTQERDEARAMNVHRLTCIHHTDAEREAAMKCPVCMKRERDAAIVQRDQALHLLGGGSLTKEQVIQSGLGEGVLIEQRHAEYLRVKAEKERDEARAKMDQLRKALELWRAYWQSPPIDPEQQGEDFTAAWYAMEEALKP